MKRARITQESGNPVLPAIVPGLNRFSTKLFEYLCLEEDKNVVVSPLGISILLAMMADGARGESLTELQSTLGLPKTTNASNAGYKALINDLNSFNNSPHCEMHVVNKIVTSDSLKIETTFNDNMDNYFSSKILAMDWTKVDEICEVANKFCDDNTKGRISSILTPDDIPVMPSVILLNAVYLKCKWDANFPFYRTSAATFQVSSKLKVEVPMMRLTWDYKYGEISELHATFIVLPFLDIRMNMMIFLPNELNGVQELEQYLCTVSFSKLLESSRSRKISLSLPKFRVEISTNVLPTLQKMGLKVACEMNEADFTGVSNSLPFCIDKVLQKTFLDVNEVGVEAAGVALGRLRGGGPPVPILEFTVNRPFVCAIIAEDYGIPLFIAKIKNPKS